MKKSIVISYSGVFCALSCAILFLGGIFTVFNYIAPMAAGFIMIMLLKTFGVKSAAAVYIGSSLISFFVVGDKECSLMYILLFGYYPIIYNYIKNIKSNVLKWVLKLILFNISMIAVQLALVYLFSIPFYEGKEIFAFAAAFAVLMNVMFVIYDILVSRLFLLYENRLEKKVKKYLRIK